MKQCFCDCVPILFVLVHVHEEAHVRYTVGPMVSLCYNDLQMAVMRQETQQCANKGSEEEDCQQVNIESFIAKKFGFVSVLWGRKSIS